MRAQRRVTLTCKGDRLAREPTAASSDSRIALHAPSPRVERPAAGLHPALGRSAAEMPEGRGDIFAPNSSRASASSAAAVCRPSFAAVMANSSNSRARTESPATK